MNLNEQEGMDILTKISACNVLSIHDLILANLKVLLAVVSLLYFDFSVEKSTLREITVFLTLVPSSSETVWNDEPDP